MFRFTLTTFAAAAAASFLIAPAPASALPFCGDSYKTGGRTKCMRILVNPLTVHKSPNGKAVCKFTDGRRFNTEKKAGTKDKRLWYSVHVKRGYLWIKERRDNGKMNIAPC